MDDRYYNLWSTDNDRLDANDEVVIKTVYDPSPVGYSLPASNAFTGFTTTGQNEGAWNIPATPELKSKFNVKGDWDKGWLFYTKPNKQGGTFFFPACGYRSYNPGSLGDVPSSGFCWIAGPDYRGYGRYLGFNSGNVYPLYGMNRSLGFAVRSAEEREMEVCVLGSCNVLTSAALHPHHAMRGSPPFMMSWMTQSHSVTPYNSQED